MFWKLISEHFVDCHIASQKQIAVTFLLLPFLSGDVSLTFSHSLSLTLLSPSLSHTHTRTHTLTLRSGASYHHLFGTLSSANGKSCYSKLHAFQSVKKMSPTGDQIAFLKWSLRGKRKEEGQERRFFSHRQFQIAFTDAASFNDWWWCPSIWRKVGNTWQGWMQVETD